LSDTYIGKLRNKNHKHVAAKMYLRKGGNAKIPKRLGGADPVSMEKCFRFPLLPVGSERNLNEKAKDITYSTVPTKNVTYVLKVSYPTYSIVPAKISHV